MKIFLLYPLMFMSSLTLAQTYKDFALMKEKSWAAFECSALSSVIKNQNEYDRLFSVGYEAGKQYIIAAKSGKVSPEEINNNLSNGFNFLINDRSADFILGGIYQNAIQEAVKGIFVAPNGSINSEYVIKDLATTKYNQKNCKLLH